MINLYIRWVGITSPAASLPFLLVFTHVDTFLLRIPVSSICAKLRINLFPLVHTQINAIIRYYLRYQPKIIMEKQKRKRTNLSVKQKLDLIKKIETGISVSRVCKEYGVKKQTVSDILKAKDKLKQFSLMSDTNASIKDRKHMKMAQETSLEQALMKWYVQQRSCGVNVRSVELKSAASTLAQHMKITFKASSGWLWRFCKRHGIVNKRTYGEALSAPTEEIEPFKQQLTEVIDDKELLSCQIYNADETGLIWRSLPENTQAYKNEKSTPGRKISKERISALLCANSEGTHRLTPVIVGTARRPRALKDCMNHLPVVYYNSKKAWFTSAIFKSWFFDHFVPEVRKFQTEVMDIPPQETRALLLLDNAPAHPSETILVTQDGKYTCMFLPKNTTSLIQPMDQGIILATKRLYRRKFLQEVMVVLEDEDTVEDTRGQLTLQNLKNYSIKSAIFNFAAAWNEVKASTLENGWNNLFRSESPDNVLTENLDVVDFQNTLISAGEDNVSENDIINWLEEDEGDPGYQILSETEIAEEVMQNNNETDKEDEEEAEYDMPVVSKTKLSDLRSYLDEVITYIDSSNDPQIQPYYSHFRSFREIIINKQYSNRKQWKIDAFFKQIPRSSKSESPQPSTSSSVTFQLEESSPSK